MAHPILLGVLGGALAARFIFRRRWQRHGGDGRSSCGGMGRGFARFGRRGRFGGQSPDEPGIRLGDLAGKLELNTRQKEDAEEVFAKLSAAAGDRLTRGAPLAGVLATVSAETFEPILAEEALGIDAGVLSPRDKDLLDSVEHLHNILTPEQREKLRQLVV